MRKSRGICAISLDAMGTLIGLRGTPQTIYHDILRDLGHPPEKISALLTDPERFRRYWRQAEERLPAAFLAEHQDRFHNYTGAPYAFWGLIFEAMFADLGLACEGRLAALEAAYRRFAQPDIWEVEPTFFQLDRCCRSRHIGMFVTSNWDTRLPELLAGLGISDHFAMIITSALARYEKPSLRIFEFLVNAAGCPPEQILHVGDDPDLDVAGAEQAGLQAVLYNPDGNDAKGPGAVAVVRSLEEVVELIQTHEHSL
jgi:2-haloacid dehalogenase